MGGGALEVQAHMVLSEAGEPVSTTPQSHIGNLLACPLCLLMLKYVLE